MSKAWTRVSTRWELTSQIALRLSFSCIYFSVVAKWLLIFDLSNHSSPHPGFIFFHLHICSLPHLFLHAAPFIFSSFLFPLLTQPTCSIVRFALPFVFLRSSFSIFLTNSLPLAISITFAYLSTPVPRPTRFRNNNIKSQWRSSSFAKSMVLSTVLSRLPSRSWFFNHCFRGLSLP